MRLRALGVSARTSRPASLKTKKRAIWNCASRLACCGIEGVGDGGEEELQAVHEVVDAAGADMLDHGVQLLLTGVG